MKKIVSLFCLIVIVLTFCSCKKNPAKTTSLSDFSSSEVAVSEDNASTESEESSSSSKTQSEGEKKDSETNENCDHYYRPATCETPGICKFCNKIIEPALGHSFVGAICSRQGCTAKGKNWVDWYKEENISITEAEVEQILSIQYKKPKNVIVMIGDGMGPNDIAMTQKIKKGCFDFGLVLNKIKYTGFATTHSYDSNVTDSAASATALATGFKTKNGYIGISPTGEMLTNISEIARQNGKRIGIVTNDSVVGATPSGFGVHNISRSNTAELAKSFVSLKADVLIGQGYSSFKNLDLSSFLVANGIEKMNYTLNSDILCKKPFMGFFSEDTISKSSNSLAYCTEIALNRLKNKDKGFFLMVENTAADVAGHNNIIEGKLNGVVTLDRAVATVLKFMKDNPDTLLIITSDHETGGVKLPEGDYVPDNSFFTTTSHTNTPVRTFAVGYGAEYFHNKTVDNTDIAKFAIDAVKN